MIKILSSFAAEGFGVAFLTETEAQPVNTRKRKSYKRFELHALIILVNVPAIIVNIVDI